MTRQPSKRVLGTVWSDTESSSLVGYVLVDTAEQFPKIMVVPERQLLDILKREPFENAEIGKSQVGNVNITDCSVTRLPRYDQQGRVFLNQGYTIIARINDNQGNPLGFRLLSTRGEILNIANDVLLKRIEEQNIYLVNAKVVQRDSKNVISAIRNNFKLIEIKSNKEQGSDNGKRITNPLRGSSPQGVKASKYPKGYTDKPEYRKNYLRKLISRVGTKALTHLKPAFPDPRSKDYTIFYKEFLRPTYPKLAEQARDDIAWTQIIGVLLLLAKGQSIPHNSGNGLSGYGVKPRKKLKVVGREVARDRGGIISEKFVTADLGQVSKTLIDIANEYDDTGQVGAVLTHYNAVLEGKGNFNQRMKKGNVWEKQELGLIQGVLKRFAVALDNEQVKDKNINQDKKRFKYSTDTVDYGNPESLGLTADYSMGNKSYESPFARSQGGVLQYVFDIRSISAYHEQELQRTYKYFGDLEIFRVLARAKNMKESGRTGDLPTIMNLYFFVLAKNNPEYARNVYEALYLENDLNYSVDDTIDFKVSMNNDDLVYYKSGLKFGAVAGLTVGDSYHNSGVSGIPRNTAEDFNEFMSLIGETIQVGTGRSPRLPW